MVLKRCNNLAKRIGLMIFVPAGLFLIYSMIPVGGFLINVLGLYFVAAIGLGLLVGWLLSRLSHNPWFLRLGYPMVGLATLVLPQMTILEQDLNGLALAFKAILIIPTFVIGPWATCSPWTS